MLDILGASESFTYLLECNQTPSKDNHISEFLIGTYCECPREAMSTQSIFSTYLIYCCMVDIGTKWLKNDPTDTAGQIF